MSSFDDTEIYRGILERLPIGFCIVDLQKKIVIWSAGAERLTGHLSHEVVGRSCISAPLLHCDHPGCEFCGEDCPVGIAIKTSQPVEGLGFLRHKAGYSVPVRIRSVPIYNRHGSILGAAETFEAAQPTDRRETTRTSINGLDRITGLGTRTMTEMYLHQILETLRKGQVRFGLLALRLEGFSQFRARFGPEAASSLLRTMARSLEGVVSGNDFIGRWSDDLLLVILNGCREDGLASVRERVRRTLSGESIEWWGERQSVFISITEAFAQPDDTVEALLAGICAGLDAISQERERAAAGAASGS